MAAAVGQDAASGALGAVVGEVAAQAFLVEKLKKGITEEDLPALKERGVNLAKLAAGMAAAVAGADVDTAAGTADNAARNNALDTVWDGLCILYDSGKIAYGLYKDDKGMVREGFIDLAGDTAAFFIPMVPAGLSRVARSADKAAEAAKAAEKVGDAAKVADEGISATRAYKHSFEYNPRVRARALDDPKGHNFPYSFDDVILSTKPARQANGSDLYRVEGFINNSRGYFEIATNPRKNEIVHRTFVRK